MSRLQWCLTGLFIERIDYLTMAEVTFSRPVFFLSPFLVPDIRWIFSPPSIPYPVKHTSSSDWELAPNNWYPPICCLFWQSLALLFWQSFRYWLSGLSAYLTTQLSNRDTAPGASVKDMEYQHPHHHPPPPPPPPQPHTPQPHPNPPPTLPPGNLVRSPEASKVSVVPVRTPKVVFKYFRPGDTSLTGFFPPFRPCLVRAYFSPPVLAPHFRLHICPGNLGMGGTSFFCKRPSKFFALPLFKGARFSSAPKNWVFYDCISDIVNFPYLNAPLPPAFPKLCAGGCFISPSIFPPVPKLFDGSSLRSFFFAFLSFVFVSGCRTQSQRPRVRLVRLNAPLGICGHQLVLEVIYHL